MAPPQYERVSQEPELGDPLASAFDVTGLNDDNEWMDDRNSLAAVASSSTSNTSIASTSASTSASGILSAQAAASNNQTATGMELSNSQPSSTGHSTSSSPSENHSRWGGLLDLISRQRSPPAEVTDGVFGNLVAKEENTEEQEPPLLDENDDITPEGQPPTYEEASADATPSYWETTIMACSYGDEIIVGHMPVGSIIIFAWNLLISSAFSYIGFLLTYLFHTTHAAKSGSLVGFGITLVQSSYDMMPIETTAPGATPEQFAPIDPNSFEDGPPVGYVLHPTSQPVVYTSQGHGTSTWFSNCVFAFGILLVLKGVWDYGMALHMEASIKRRRREQEEQSENARTEAELANALGPDATSDTGPSGAVNSGSASGSSSASTSTPPNAAGSAWFSFPISIGH